MDQPTSRPTLMLIDGYAMIFRAYYAMIRAPRMTSTGTDTTAIFGFVNILQNLLRQRHPTHLAVCLDPGGKTFRHEAYEPYKANREKTPEAILTAIPYIKTILQAYRVPVIVAPGFEADDVIGTLSRQAEAAGFLTLMVTGDKDFGQLVTENVHILNPGKHEELGVEEVKAKYGIDDPRQVIDLLGLMGDSSDNIPGCPGVGIKTAEKLIVQYGSVENLLDHADELKGSLGEKVRANAEQIRMSKWLATINLNAPVTLDAAALQVQEPDNDALREVYGQLEFRSLLAALGDKKPAVAPPPKPAQRQLSLFDDEPAAEPAPVEEHVVESAFQAPQTTVVNECADAETWVKTAVAAERVAVVPVIEGEDAMRAELVGIAACADGKNATYFPCDPFGTMLRALAPLFTDGATIVGDDIKRLMVMLRVRGLAFTAGYYDTAVAHYLLQPERSHYIAAVAAEMLHFQCVSTDDVLGEKGRNRLKFPQAPVERVGEWACQRAAAAWALPEPLDKALADEELTHLLTDIELPLIAVLADMEMAGARIDVAALKEYSVKLSDEAAAIENECYELAGERFNTASPAQVGNILFGKLQIDPKAKKTKTGQYSTTEEILQRLRSRHPLVDKILKLRGLRKLLSTYVNALPALINPATGRVHTTYHQTVTATGRLSSSNPNLQNIPVRTDDGKEIRRAFIPSPGNRFFSADYSQIELRLVADLSGDETMKTAFLNGEDIHAITAAKVFHKSPQEVSADERRKAKTANFGILYGISAFGLAERLLIPRKEAQELIDGYFATFPAVRAYIDRSVAQAHERGYVTTLLGRRRYLPDINSRNATVRNFSERNAVNAPIQGTAADVIKIAMVAIARRFKQEGLRSQMILQVHDELNFDVVPDELERVEQIVVEEMQNAYHGSVPLTVSHAAADNWLDAH